MPNMKVTLARIDNRLMHGIVMTQYLPSTNSQRIMVIDDATANDALKKQMMNMAKPNGYASSIITLETAINNTKAGKYDGQRVFVLSKTPDAFLKLIEAGVKIDKLIVGCTDLLGEGHKLSDRAYVTDDQLAMLKQIAASGTRVVVQHNPAVSEVSIDKFI